MLKWSPSTRREWIEMQIYEGLDIATAKVSLHTEGVD